MINISLTEEEYSILCSAVGAMLDAMAQDVPPGQPVPQAMLDMEALQSKLMTATSSGTPK
jgi:hypothetical protein